MKNFYSASYFISSSGSIEKKISALMNLQRLREIQDQVIWPVLGDNEKKSEIPDVCLPDFSKRTFKKIYEFVSWITVSPLP